MANQDQTSLIPETRTPVIPVETPFGQRELQLDSNRVRDPRGTFEFFWDRHLTFPASINGVLLDVATTICVSCGVTLVLTIVPLVGSLVFLLFLGVVAYTASLATEDNPKARKVLFYRVLFICLGVICGLF